MNTYVKSAASLLTGFVGFLIAGIGVTELLDPYIWPSVLVGLPVGLGAGIALGPLTYVSITYLEGRRATGTASTQTVRRLWTTVAAIVGFVAGGGLATVALSTQAVGFLSALILAGVPVGLVTGVLAAYLAYRRRGRTDATPASPVR